MTLHLHESPLIIDERARINGEIEALFAGPPSADSLLAFLLRFGALRINALRQLPRWLRGAAGSCAAAGHPTLAAQLERSAELESEHRLLIIDDFVAVHERWRRDVDPAGLNLLTFVQRSPNAATLRHVDERRRVLLSGTPVEIAAVEYELARLGQVFGPWLIAACEAVLGSSTVMSFARARTLDALRRVPGRRAALELLAASDPELAKAATLRALAVARSYLAALTACFERPPTSPSARQLAPDPASSGAFRL